MNHEQQVRMANVLARIISEKLPLSHGFCLIIFPLHTPLGAQSVSTYIANVNRPAVHQELRGLVAKWDADDVSSATPEERELLPLRSAALALLREVNGLQGTNFAKEDVVGMLGILLPNLVAQLPMAKP